MGLFSWLFGKKKEDNIKQKAVTAQPTEQTEIKREAYIAEKTVKIEETAHEKPQDKEKINYNARLAKAQAALDMLLEKEMYAEGRKQTEKESAEPPTQQDSEAAQGFTGTFEINKAKDGKQYFFNLYASNKVGIATSQMYASAQSALTGVNSVIANAAKAPIEDQSLKTYETLPYPKWEIYMDNGGKYRFRLNASNGSCVCHSQGYTSKSSCKNGIESIIKSSRNPKIVKSYIKKK
jgi:uncharacterized protein YegP (UPF0339 family)